MASVASYGAGDRFIIRLFYFLAINPGAEYNTQVTVEALTGGGLPELTECGVRFADCMGRMMFDTVALDRITISTFVEDSRPYDPNAFVSQEIEVGPIGRNSSGQQILAARNVLKLAKKVPTGRQGKISLRFALSESDVQAPAGEMVLTNEAAITSALEQALTLSQFDEYFPAQGGIFNPVLLNVSPVGPFYVSRYVTNIVVNGAGFNSTNHKHYDVGGEEYQRRAKKADRHLALLSAKQAALEVGEG